MRFSRDRRGQSVVVGTVILFGFLILALSLYQVQIVPQQNAQVEFQHFEEARNDLVELRAGILQAGSIDRTQYQTVRLGTSYSTRLFTINPPAPAGEIRTTESYPITISNGSDTVTIPTRFLQYRPGYNEIDRSPTWYDASALYLDARDDGGGIAVIEGQELVTDSGEVRVVALQNEFRRSGTGGVTLELRPAESITGSIPEGDLNVTVPTRLSGDEYWNETDIPADTYGGVTGDANGDGVHNLTLETTATNLTVDTVGVQKAPEDPTQNVDGALGGGGAGGGGDGGGGADSLPAGKVAYDDANNNGAYDTGETTYEGPDLQSFDRSVNLVVARDVSEASYDIQADSITVDSGVTLSAQNGQVGFTSSGQIRVSGTLDTTPTNGNGISLDGGNLDLTDGTLRASASVQLSSQGQTDLDGSVIDTTTLNGAGVSVVSNSDLSVGDAEIESGGTISLESSSGQISGSNALFDTTRVNSNSISLTAGTEVQVGESEFLSGGSISITGNGGLVDLAGSTLDATQVNSESITLESNGNMILDRASLRVASGGGLTGSLNGGNEELFVQDAEFLRSGSGATFDYSPNGVDVIGTPARGSTG
ncbi:hypothetical protein ABNG03_14655 [Halorubrum sp. RMP-47]|uniref:Uncharacterized protein n=1 Tax=Halorubrum miltondacostae TaxID=3076378 RepID=A0ABD5M1V5_9EURY